MTVLTILSSPFMMLGVLPFLLIFTVVFAVLEKTQIFGKGKKQIDAIVALVIGLMFIAFGNAVGIAINFIPVLGVLAVIILVFMLLYGMVFKEGEFAVPKGLQIGIGAVVGLVVIITTIVLTGAWDYFRIHFWQASGFSLFIDVVIALVIIGAVIAVILGGGSGSGKSGKD